MSLDERFATTDAADVEVSQCVTCRHFRTEGDCKAFPDGIPYAIRSNLHDHRQPYEGDQGVRWQARRT